MNDKVVTFAIPPHPKLYPRAAGALMELLVIRLGRQETTAKSLIIPRGGRRQT